MTLKKSLKERNFITEKFNKHITPKIAKEKQIKDCNVFEHGCEVAEERSEMLN